MKILFLSENFYPEVNAAANRVYERARIWANWGHNVTVLCTAPNFPGGIVYSGYKNNWYMVQKIDQIKVARVKTYISANKGKFRRSIDFLTFGISGFLAAMFIQRPDVIVATSPQFFCAIAGWAASKLRKLPFVFEVGDIWPASFKAVGVLNEGIFFKLLETFELFLYKQANAIVVLSPAFKINLISRGVDPNKITTVLNGVDRSKFFPIKRSINLAKKFGLKNEFVIGYFGTIGMAHGLSNVIETAKILRKQTKMKFVLVGAGAEQEVLQEMVIKNKTQNVLFLPQQPRHLMPEIWSLCDIALVHLKKAIEFSEVIPSKIFEAMATGHPIILASPQGAAEEIIKKEEVGLWVPPENPEALADAILTLAQNRELSALFGKNGVQNSRKYSRERQATEMMIVLNQLFKR